MDDKSIAKLRCELAVAMAAGKAIDTVRRLKDMPIGDLEALSNAELRELVDLCGMDEMSQRDMEKGLKKLNFYVCGVLMHRVLEGE